VRVEKEGRSNRARFFAAVFEGVDGLVEARALPSQRRAFFETSRLQEMESFVHTWETGDIYFGVATRRARGDGRREGCLHLSSLFVDVDFKRCADPDIRRRVARIVHFPLPPSIIVSSGGGVHLYWLLKRLADVQIEEAHLSSLLQQLAHHLGGDPASAELSRILRVPGTFNHKYDPPREVWIERLEPESRYTLDDFKDLLPKALRNGYRANLAPPEKVYEGERNDTLYRHGRSMHARGMSPEAIKAALEWENRVKCQPPLTDEELAGIMEKAITQADRPGFSLGSEGAKDGGSNGHHGGPTQSMRDVPLISYQTIMGEPLPEVEWTVEPLIATGSRVVLYGEFGSMKSWVLLHLALHIAAGQPWLGQFTIPHARSVLYVDEEMNTRTLWRRIKRLGLGAGFEAKALPFQTLSRFNVRFNGQGAENLLHVLRESHFDPEVIIVESLRRVLVGSENEAKDVSAFWRNVEPILKAGKTLITSHHMRKPNAQGSNASRDRASGSTDILAGADAGFAVERKGAAVIEIGCVKSRDAEEASPFVVRLSDEDKESPVELRYEGSPEEFNAEGTKANQAFRELVTFLSTAPERIATTDAIRGYLEKRGISGRTTERAMKEAKKQGRLTNPRRGEWQLKATDAP